MVGFIEKKRKAAKAALISRRPGLYWSYRKLRRGWAEKELPLLPAFCAEGSVAVDIGANHGLFTHYLTPLCETLHVFDPSPRMAALLRSGYGRRGNVEVHEVALSNRSGTATLRVPRFLGLSGYATLEEGDLSDRVDISDGLEEIEVPTRRLDELGLRDVSFIKVDVEGHEQEVLEGAVETLERESAIVLAELEERHREGAVENVRRLMEGLGYRGFFLRGRELHRMEQLDLALHQDMERPDDYVRNFLFVAPARRDALATRLAQEGYTLL